MDSLKTIVKMMEYLQENYESIKEEQIIEKFGKKNWRMFCQWGMNSDASTKGEAYGVGRSGTINLTQLGSRKLYELRRTIAEERRAEWMKWITITLAVFTGVDVFLKIVKWS